jgi:hypothetical protein
MVCKCGKPLAEKPYNPPPHKSRYYRCGHCGRLPEPQNLADPTTVIVTDGSPEAEASVMRDRIEADRRLRDMENNFDFQD